MLEAAAGDVERGLAVHPGCQLVVQVRDGKPVVLADLVFGVLARSALARRPALEQPIGVAAIVPAQRGEQLVDIFVADMRRP